MDYLEKAIETAVYAHKGQKDKAGEPYVLHPIRVMLNCTGETEKICAVLHDVIEDTELTLEDLRKKGFPEEVIQTVDSLSKREGEKYFDYIERVCKNRTACLIKVQDLKDNMKLDRIKNPGKNDFKRIEKYADALERIYEVLREK